MTNTNGRDSFFFWSIRNFFLSLIYRLFVTSGLESPNELIILNDLIVYESKKKLFRNCVRPPGLLKFSVTCLYTCKGSIFGSSPSRLGQLNSLSNDLLFLIINRELYNLDYDQNYFYIFFSKFSFHFKDDIYLIQSRRF